MRAVTVIFETGDASHEDLLRLMKDQEEVWSIRPQDCQAALVQMHLFSSPLTYEVRSLHAQIHIRIRPRICIASCVFTHAYVQPFIWTSRSELQAKIVSCDMMASVLCWPEEELDQKN